MGTLDAYFLDEYLKACHRSKDHLAGVDSTAPLTNCALSNHSADTPCITRALRARDYHSYDIASPVADKNHHQVGTKRKFSERELNSPPAIDSDSEMIDGPAHNLRHRLPQVIS